MYAAMKRFLPIFAIFAVFVPPASAQTFGLIDNFGDWSAFAGSDDGGRVCYMASAPKKEEGKYTKRGKTYITITHFADERSFDVVSVTAGYSYKKGSEVEVAIGDAKHKLFTKGEGAWAYDSKADRNLVKALKAGSKAIVRGVSTRGTKTKDTYSLKGSSAAYKAINKACGR